MDGKSRNSLKLDSRPLYDRALDALHQFIQQGGYQPGDRLPGEAALAGQLGISRPTLREAMGNLEAQGIVNRRHGVGTFVTAPARGTMQGGLDQLESVSALAANAGVDAQIVDWVVQEVGASSEIAEQLEIEPGTPMARVQMTVRNESCIFAYLDNYILASAVDLADLKVFDNGSLLDFLTEQDEPRLSYTNTHLYSVEADEETAGWLKAPEGRPLMLLTETYYTETGIPMVYDRNFFITDCLNFRITRRIVQRRK